MPAYEFKCVDCFGLLTIMAGFKEEPKPKCPNCGGAMNKVFSSPPVTFKGSGWASKDK
jgi:hypothetical protein